MGETSTRACEKYLASDWDLRDEIVHDKAANPRGTRKEWQLDVIVGNELLRLCDDARFGVSCGDTAR